MTNRFQIIDMRCRLGGALSRTASSGQRSAHGARPMHPARRAGMTLMELLIVIFLVGLITAITIPVLNPQAAPKRIREGARLVGGAFGIARARAVSEGRSVGVWLERQPSPRDSACFKLFFAEQPQTYSGENLNSTVTVNSSGNATFTGINGARIQNGDLLQINYQAHLYTVTKVSGFTYSTTSKTSPTGKAAAVAVGVPFQIFRQPIRSAEKPIQLPNGIAIDLAASGFTGSSADATGTNPLIIMFSPGGAMSTVYNLTGTATKVPTDTLFLLVGRSDGLIKEYPGDATNNLGDPGSIWVAVGNQTGMVSTVENNGSTDVNTARSFALNRSSMGGR